MANPKIMVEHTCPKCGLKQSWYEKVRSQRMAKDGVIKKLHKCDNCIKEEDLRDALVAWMAAR